MSSAAPPHRPAVAGSSFLYVPAHKPRALEKALSGSTRASCVIVDLEDGVPVTERGNAEAALEHLTVTLPSAPPTLCRIRSGNAERLADLQRVPSWFAGVVLAKSETAQDAEAVADQIAASGRSLTLWPLIETARGVENLHEILASRVDFGGVLFGAGDLRADLGLFDEYQGAIDYGRVRIVYAARASGVEQIIDSPEGQISPDAGFDKAIGKARALGFTGKCAIHPDQVAPINAGFRPTPQQLAWAREVLTSGDGAQRVGPLMVDEATKRTARRMIAAVELTEG